MRWLVVIDDDANELGLIRDVVEPNLQNLVDDGWGTEDDKPRIDVMVVGKDADLVYRFAGKRLYASEEA